MSSSEGKARSRGMIVPRLNAGSPWYCGREYQLIKAAQSPVLLIPIQVPPPGSEG